MLFVSCKLEAVEWVHQSKFPEQIWYTIKHVRDELLVGICYRSVNETLFPKENNDKLRELIAEIKNKQVLLIGTSTTQILNGSDSKQSQRTVKDLLTAWRTRISQGMLQEQQEMKMCWI